MDESRFHLDTFHLEPRVFKETDKVTSGFCGVFTATALVALIELHVDLLLLNFREFYRDDISFFGSNENSSTVEVPIFSEIVNVLPFDSIAQSQSIIHCQTSRLLITT